MKNVLSGVWILFFIFFIGTTDALADKSCEMKEERLLEQLEQAQSYGNRGRIKGLERALANVRAYCTEHGNTSLINKKIRAKREKMAKREKELYKAIHDNDDAEKITTKRKKLVKALEELNEALEEFELALPNG